MNFVVVQESCFPPKSNYDTGTQFINVSAMSSVQIIVFIIFIYQYIFQLFTGQRMNCKYELGKLFLGPFEIAVQITSQDRLFSVTSCTPRMKMFWFNILLFGYQVSFSLHIQSRNQLQIQKRSWKNLPLCFCYSNVSW